MSLNDSKLLVFGNTKGNTESLRRILRMCDEEGINNLVTLGRLDAGNCCSPGLSEDKLEEVYRSLVDWAEFSPERTWIGIMMQYDGVPFKFAYKYISPDGKHKRTFHRDGNLFFAHYSDTLLNPVKEEVEARRKAGIEHPIIAFYSHSYYMGYDMDRPYDDEKTIMNLARETNQKIEIPIEDGKVYWISTGPNQQPVYHSSPWFANFAVYDPGERVVTLKSVFYKPKYDRNLTPKQVARLLSVRAFS